MWLAKNSATASFTAGGLLFGIGALTLKSENYPNLRANQGFRDLSAQLEGTENRITVARMPPNVGFDSTPAKPTGTASGASK